MHSDRIRVAFDSLGARAVPDEAVVERVMQARLFHARVRDRIPDIDRVRVPTGRHHVEIAFAFQAELVPGLAAVLAAQEAERVHQPGARGRMPAAVDVFHRRRETHVVMLRTRRLGPFAVLVDREAVVTGDDEPLAVRAVGEPVDVSEQISARGRGRDSQRREQRGDGVMHVRLPQMVHRFGGDASSRILRTSSSASAPL